MRGNIVRRVVPLAVILSTLVLLTATLGNHNLSVKAYDQAGNIKTSAVTVVKVVDTAKPTVSITSPTNNSQVTRNTTITIRAIAADNRDVAKVEFYVNKALKCTDTTDPYTCNWAVPSSRGTKYTLTARAYDTSGNTTDAIITVTSR